jgi:hypothetical protein
MLGRAARELQGGVPGRLGLADEREQATVTDPELAGTLREHQTTPAIPSHSRPSAASSNVRCK